IGRVVDALRLSGYPLEHPQSLPNACDVHSKGFPLICPNCSAENEPGRKFCGECGTRLIRTCPNCGFGNSPSTRFCGECGTRLDDAGASLEIRSGGAQGAGPSATDGGARGAQFG